ncbi:hypothetical protein VNO80_03215 [Phaseolus coccineus]|uniref:Uncharacterized protein n=1 Tax=Phaseolus coccineus TaxID=3886 RepID=A0AAN9NY94_PHACN
MELPANKSSHSRLTKHSFGVEKGEGFLYYVVMDRLVALPLRDFVTFGVPRPHGPLALLRLAGKELEEDNPRSSFTEAPSPRANHGILCIFS